MTEPAFDPRLAPKVQLTGADRAAINADINKVAMKLREAGIQLWGFYRVHDFVPYWNPLGFDFMCDNWQALLDAASRAKGLGTDFIDMPGGDNWGRAGVKSVGFTQLGRAPHAHLDIAIDRPGLCRLYLLDDRQERELDALRNARVVNTRTKEVFRKIAARLEGLGVDLDSYIGGYLDVGRSVLDGVSFVANDHEKLDRDLTGLTYPGGGKVFFRGGRSARGHFAGNLSFLATEGVGFRQIWRTDPAERPAAAATTADAPAMNAKASARFGDSQNVPDLTSVHWAVSKRLCNVHIDEMGFVVVDANGTVIVDPDALRHIFVELLWKTDLQGKLPFWALDNVNFVIPSSPNDFSRVGVTVDVARFGRISIALNGTCSLDGKMETSGTMTLGFRF
jgi:hypothetical protein